MKPWRSAVVAVVALAGCSVELGPTEPWIDAADLQGPMAPEVVEPPATMIGAWPTQIRVVSFNVEKGADVDGLAEVIRNNPGLAEGSILLLQEIESHPGEGGSRASRLAAALGMGYVYAPERTEGDGTHGPAILSRWPLSNVRTMKLPYAALAISRAPRIALAAEVWIGDQVLNVIDLHLDTRLNVNQRVLQMRPAVLDAPWPTVVGGDLNMNPYVWIGDVVPQVPTNAAVDTDQAPMIDDYMRHIEYATPTALLGPTLRFGGVVDARLDAIYTRGVTSVPGEVERTVTISDHWPLFIDVVLR